jgi:hypothetical protein
MLSDEFSFDASYHDCIWAIQHPNERYHDPYIELKFHSGRLQWYLQFTIGYLFIIIYAFRLLSQWQNK